MPHGIVFFDTLRNEHHVRGLQFEAPNPQKGIITSALMRQMSMRNISSGIGTIVQSLEIEYFTVEDIQLL